MSHIEKRKHLRLKAIRSMALVNKQNGALIGHLENISVGGMMLMSASPQAVGQELDVNLFLGKSIDGEVAVRCRVCCVWSGENLWRESDPSKKYCTGLEITSISDNELEAFLAVIETLEEVSR